MTDEHLISLQPGTVIGGKYEVVKCLGSGSMGLVYACRHRELQGQMVAIKVLYPEVAQDKVASARFRNEILASYGVSHPNVVRAYEYIRDGELIAYTMEFVNGGDLAEQLGQAERLPIPEIIRLLSQMAAGVQAIHDAGIVHRDLKPENILLSKEGSVKIADFGIARNRHGPKLTEHGGVVGTIDYVAPEYMLRAQVDWRSDIYALGILAYEMVTGESPFRGDSVYATMTKRLKTDPEPPSKHRSDCPPELDAIVLKAMQRDPDTRYQSAMEIFFDLQRIAVDRGMRSAITGGLFLPNQAGGQATSYVGPSLSESPTEGANQIKKTPNETQIALSSGPLELGGSALAAAGGGAAGGAAGSWQTRSRWGAGKESPTRARSDSSDPIDNSPASQNTEVLSAEFVDYAVETQTGPAAITTQRIATQGVATQEFATQRPAGDLPQLGAAGDLLSEGWGHPKSEPQKRVVVSDRAREFPKKYAATEQKRSRTGDIIALGLAALIGIGFGVVFLKLFAPALLAKFQF